MNQFKGYLLGLPALAWAIIIILIIILLATTAYPAIKDTIIDIGAAVTGG